MIERALSTMAKEAELESDEHVIWSNFNVSQSKLRAKIASEEIWIYTCGWPYVPGVLRPVE